MRRKEEPMADQKSVNEEKNRHTQRQEIEVITEREKIGDGAIRKMETHREIDTKPKPVEEKDTQKREGQRKMIKERKIKTENSFGSVYYRRRTQNYYGKKKYHPKLSK